MNAGSTGRERPSDGGDPPESRGSHGWMRRNACGGQRVPSDREPFGAHNRPCEGPSWQPEPAGSGADLRAGRFSTAVDRIAQRPVPGPVLRVAFSGRSRAYRSGTAPRHLPERVCGPHRIPASGLGSLRSGSGAPSCLPLSPPGRPEPPDEACGSPL